MKRNIHIDACKGVAMIIIVMVHTYWLVMGHAPVILKRIGEIGAIDVFFALSAYLFEKKKAFTPGVFLRRIIKLAMWLIGFSLLFCIIENVSISQMCIQHFMGYWFFAALLIFYFLVGIIKLFKKKYGIKTIYELQIYCGLWIIIWALSLNVDPELPCLPLNDLRMYFPSYIIGLMLVRYSAIKKYALGMIGITIATPIWIAIIAGIIPGKNELLNLCGILSLPLMMYVGNILTQLTKFIPLVGKKSLWIYGYHYLFLIAIAAITNRLSLNMEHLMQTKAWLAFIIVVAIAIVVSLICIMAGTLTKFVFSLFFSPLQKSSSYASLTKFLLNLRNK